MSIEIERKYLVKNDDWMKFVSEKQHITQGYIKSEDATVRIRCYKDVHCAEITVKGKRQGISRLEYEYDIPYLDAKEMQDNLCQKRLVEKTRHIVYFAEMKWEIDVFHADNEGLVVAEIELTSVDQEYKIPDWIDKDVSDDNRYRNSRLAMNPFNEW